MFDICRDKIEALNIKRTFSLTPKVSETKIIGDVDEQSENFLQNAIKEEPIVDHELLDSGSKDSTD